MLDREAWINLALVKGIGPKTFQRLNEYGVSAKQIYDLEFDELRGLGIPETSANTILKHPPTLPSKDVEQALIWQAQPNHHLVTINDDSYPERLLHIATPPPLLMVKGCIHSIGLPQVAIVGSRYPSQSGQTQAFEFAEALTDMGFVITSGLARGVDSFAHKGALQSGGKTVAVLGTGLNHIYPKQNKRLADEISESGSVISEFSLSSIAHAGHFPRRNRIVSGLSLGVLVIEATLKSGSLITARQALEQNREVFALPGSLSNPQKAGCHHLIRAGAELVENPEQVLNALGDQIEFPKSSQELGKSHFAQRNDVPIGDMAPEQISVLNKLDYDGMPIDLLAEKSKVPVHELTVVLMDLELQGLIRQEQGLFSRI